MIFLQPTLMQAASAVLWDGFGMKGKMRPHQSTKGCPRFALSADICLKMIY
jgi:hypothetical protein